MTNTVNNAIPFVPENTIDPAAGLNVSLLTIDMLLNISVESIGDNSPPGTAANGARYVIGSSASGLWAGHSKQLAMWVDDGFWIFRSVSVVFNKTTNSIWIYNDSVSAWEEYAPSGGQTQSSSVLLPPNVQSVSSYRIALADSANAIEMDYATQNYVVVPSDIVTNFPIGSTVLITQKGVGKTTVSPEDETVIIRCAHGTNSLKYMWSSCSLRKRAANEWVLEGNLAES